MNRQGFLKLLAFIPAGLLPIPAVQFPTKMCDEYAECGCGCSDEHCMYCLRAKEDHSMSKYPVEIQIEDTEAFRPDGFYGALAFTNNHFILHYVHDGEEHNSYHRYGFWTTGESGLPRVVVTDRREPCVRTNLIIAE